MTRSDTRNKEVALGRIKRLASSGLPLDSFVRSTFEFVGVAIPHSPNRTFHIGGERPDAYICNSAELTQVIPLHSQFFVESPPEVSGARFRVNPVELHRRFPSKVTFMHEEVTLPHLYRSEAFHTVFKPWGFHHCLMAMFQEPCEYLGCYPIWRGVDQPPFDGNDAKFIRAAAPSISHGLKVAQLLKRSEGTDNGDFEPLPGWGSGMLLVDKRGEIIAQDPEAGLTLQQLRVLDGTALDRIGSEWVRNALASIARSVTLTFANQSDSDSAKLPASTTFHHWSGMVLRLRGFRLGGVDGSEYITILVERGETGAARQRRLQFRWGLSDREAEVLALIGNGKTGPEISIILNISHDTARKHLAHIFEKLGVENRTEAALTMRDAR